MSGRRCKALRAAFQERYDRAPMRTLRGKNTGPTPEASAARMANKKWWRMGWLIQKADTPDDKARIRSEWRAVKRTYRETRKVA
jgi:hypothetical protein